MFSVLIGRVSTEDGGRILETLESLRRQEGGHPCEVIVADRRDDEVSRRIERDYPEVALIRCPPQTPLPELRAAALDRAAGRYVVVTEDHCVPAADWLDGMARAFRAAPAGTAAVGGCVENGVRDTPLDWATFLCEYSGFLAPVAEGETAVLPGMNVAYERRVLQDLDRSLLTQGFWETTVHPVLRQAGRTLFSTNGAKLLHCKRFSFGLFVRQRFLYSRYYAGLRFARGQRVRRAIAFAAAPLLPPILLYRVIRQTRAKGRPRSELLPALPLLAVFVFVWAWGEMVGYALGAGNALARIE
jgi:hypothetical protein